MKNTRVIGKMEKKTAKAFMNMGMGRSISEIFKRDKNMDLGKWSIRMEVNLKVNGKMTRSMGLV